MLLFIQVLVVDAQVGQNKKDLEYNNREADDRYVEAQIFSSSLLFVLDIDNRRKGQAEEQYIDSHQNIVKERSFDLLGEELSNFLDSWVPASSQNKGQQAKNWSIYHLCDQKIEWATKVEQHIEALIPKPSQFILCLLTVNLEKICSHVFGIDRVKVNELNQLVEEDCRECWYLDLKQLQVTNDLQEFHLSYEIARADPKE